MHQVKHFKGLFISPLSLSLSLGVWLFIFHRKTAKFLYHPSRAVWLLGWPMWWRTVQRGWINQFLSGPGGRETMFSWYKEARIRMVDFWSWLNMVRDPEMVFLRFMKVRMGVIGWFSWERWESGAVQISLTLRITIELLLVEMMLLGPVKVKRRWFVITEVLMEERCRSLQFCWSQCTSKLVLNKRKL